MKPIAELERDMATFQDDLLLAEATAADKTLKKRDRRAARASARHSRDLIRACGVALDEAAETEAMLVEFDVDQQLVAALRRFRRRVAREKLASLPNHGLWSRWEADGTLRVGPAHLVTPDIKSVIRKCKETLQEECCET